MFVSNRVTQTGYGGIASGSQIVNCDFIANRSFGDPSAVSGLMANSLFLNNRNVYPPDAGTPIEEMQVPATGSSIQRCLIEGWTGTIAATATADAPVDLTFMDPDGPDNIPGNDDDDYRLAFHPALVDSGDSTLVPAGFDLDISGLPRFFDCPDVPNTGVPLPDTSLVVDIGPTEYQQRFLRFVGDSGSFTTSANWPQGLPGPTDAVLFDRDPAGPPGVVSVGTGAATGPARFQGGGWEILGGSGQWTVGGDVLVGPAISRHASLVLENCRIAAAKTLIDAGGSLQFVALSGLPGSPALFGPVLNLGNIQGGLNVDHFPTLSIQGSYSQAGDQGGRSQTGTMTMALGNLGAGLRGDRMDVTGSATLGGSLVLQIASGTGPLTPGERWTILSAAGGVQGRFGLVQAPTLSGDLFLAVEYLPNEVDVVVRGRASQVTFGAGEIAQLLTTLSPKAIAIGDFDGHNGDDVAIAVSAGSTGNGSVYVFYSLPRTGPDWPGFDPVATQITVGVNPIALDRGTIDGSDFDDLVVANNGSSNLSVLLSLPDRQFASGTPIALGRTPTCVSVADFVLATGLVRDDIAVGVRSNPQTRPPLPAQVFLFANNNQPIVGFAQRGDAVALEDEPDDSSPTDGDPDKPIDVAVAMSGRDLVRVLRNVTSEGRSFEQGASINVSGGPTQIVGRTRRTPFGVPWCNRPGALDTFLDLDRDGKADLITVNPAGRRLSIIRNTSPGGSSTVIAYDPAVDFEVRAQGTGALLTPWALTAADLDGDGDCDLAVIASVNAQTPGVFSVRNDLDHSSPGGSPVLTAAVPIPDLPSGTPLLLSSGDVDLDGRNDVVVVAQSTGFAPGYSLVPRRNTNTRCRADLDDGSGSGTQDGAVTIDDLLYFLGAYEAGGLAADLDDGSGDGVRDGAVTIDDFLYFLDHYEGGC